MGPFDVLGNVILLTPKAAADRIQARVAAEVDLVNGVASGACHLPNEAGLIFKAVGRETMQVKSKVREFWGIAREEITGKGCLRGGKVAACRRSRFASSIAICAA
jgi:urease accessory protein